MNLQDKDLFRQQAYIGGDWVDADNGATLSVNNPATDEIIGNIPNMGADETRHAIDAANKAYPDWRKKTAGERAILLRRWYELILENQEDLAQLMTAEQGKPIAEARGEIVYAASFVEWFAEEGKRIYGDTIPPHQADKRIIVTKEPVGVCAAITPWNFPSAMLARKVAPALAAGCTMVMKPARETPFSAIALCVLAERAGIPGGVVDLVTGNSKTIGSELASNPIVRKLTFTGSTQIGQLLMQQSAMTLKKMSLELGGNAPFIVFDDADLDSAVDGAIMCKYRNTGQTCVCANRLYIQDKIHDAFIDKFSTKVAELNVGQGTESGVNQGPLINAAAVEKVESHIADAVNKGAQIAIGGSRHELGGTFFQPTVMTGVTSDMLCASDETFGPVAAIFRFKTEEDVINFANDTEYGLAAYFYSRDIGRVWRVADALEYGMIGINTGIISTAVAPFGGMKFSGFGREGSKYGIEDYLEIKYLCMGDI